MRLASRPAPPCCAPAPVPPSCIAIAMRSMQRLLLYDYAKKVYKLNSRQPAGRVYPHEIDIQETHPKHRKLDSQAALPHPTRGRAADGLRAQVQPLWASRRDHDPGRLSPRSAGVGSLRPAMAADRTVRGPPATFGGINVFDAPSRRTRSTTRRCRRTNRSIAPHKDQDG